MNMSTIESMKDYIKMKIDERGFDENGDILIDFSGLCDDTDVILAAAELGCEATLAQRGEGCWWISLSDSNWRTFDAAKFLADDGKAVIIGIRVNEKTREAHEAVLDPYYGWDSDISYAAIGIDSSDVACALDFEGARASGYRFPED